MNFTPFDTQCYLTQILLIHILCINILFLLTISLKPMLRSFQVIFLNYRRSIEILKRRLPPRI
jgi:hypothetical protein